MYETDQINEYDDWISKSQLKRDSKKLHAIGESIVKLSQSEFERIDFSPNEDFKKELEEARRCKEITQFEPYRRQMLHIERVMRSLDEEYIEKLQNEISASISKKIGADAKLHRLEKLRGLLLSPKGNEILNSLCGMYRDLDRNKLRSLVSNAKKETTNSTNMNYSREVFRFLRDNISDDLHDFMDELKNN